MDGFSHSEDIAAKVRTLVAESIHQPVAAIPLDARLDATELGIDSLGLIKLVVRIEETFDIVMPDLASPEAAELGTVREVAAMVTRELQARGNGGAK